MAKWQQGPQQVKQPFLSKAALSRRIKGEKKKPGWGGTRAANPGGGTSMVKPPLHARGPIPQGELPRGQSYPGLDAGNKTTTQLWDKIKKYQRANRRSL